MIGRTLQIILKERKFKSDILLPFFPCGCYMSHQEHSFDGCSDININTAIADKANADK